MSEIGRRVAAAIMLGAFTLGASATDLKLRVKGAGPAERIVAKYRCDADGVRLGLPSGVFTVQYVNSGENHLAIVPIQGKDRVFAGVIAANGGRYVAAGFEWWTVGNETTFTDSMKPDRHASTCTSID